MATVSVSGCIFAGITCPCGVTAIDAGADLLHGADGGVLPWAGDMATGLDAGDGGPAADLSQSGDGGVVDSGHPVGLAPFDGGP